MVKLTTELIEQALQSTNALSDRELDMRGFKIPLLENLGATLDQFDTLDFSDNEIRKLDGFPLLKRLKAVVMHNNKLVRIGEGLDDFLPNLETLILTNNNLQELKDLDPLASLKNLEMLCLVKNPVALKTNYRLYVVYKLPQVRILDYRRIKQRERDQAATIFRSKRVAKGANTPADSVTATKTFTPGAPVIPSTGPARNNPVPASPMSILPAASLGGRQPGLLPRAGAKRPAPVASGQDLQAIREAIKRANTLEEVERLNQLLCSGQFAGFATQPQVKSGGENEAEMEEDVENIGVSE